MPTARKPEARPVLIVEDDRPTAELTAEIVTLLGHPVLVAYNGQDAISLARLHLPALILMDVQMPGMDGLTATRRLKGDHATAAIPIICVTALAMEHEAELCLEAGADLHLAKPLDFPRLEETLTRYLRPTPGPADSGPG